MNDFIYARVDRWPDAQEWPADTSRVLLRKLADGYHEAVEGDPSAPLRIPPSRVEYIHPLTVLDLDDKAKMGAIVYDLISGNINTPTLVKVLSRFTPEVRLPEPERVGALVRDPGDRLWVRVQQRVNTPRRWVRLNDPYLERMAWSAVPSPVIVQEGP